MLVDLILGTIFITSIICFTVYKIDKNNNPDIKKKKKERKAKREQTDFVDIFSNNFSKSENDARIGFELKKGKEVLKKDDPNDKDK